MDSALTQLKVIWLVLLLAVGVDALLSLLLPVHAVAPAPIMFRAIGLLAACEVVLLFVFRRKYVLQNAEALSSGASNEPAMARWRTGHIVTWALSLSIAMYGIVLRFVGFEFKQVSIFFIAGAALMLLLAPRRPAERYGS